jgi:hypothetical protein
VDFDEVFAPMAWLESIRLLLTYMVGQGWPINHMDVKSAFLNGDLQEEVYITQPLGFTMSGDKEKVLRLLKALYRLHQAPWAWYAKLDAALVALRFHHSESEHEVYKHGGGLLHQHRLIVKVYVDDLVITSGNITELKQFKKEMQNTFQMADLGLVRYYLGLEVDQGDSGVTVS